MKWFGINNKGFENKIKAIVATMDEIKDKEEYNQLPIDICNSPVELIDELSLFNKRVREFEKENIKGSTIESLSNSPLVDEMGILEVALLNLNIITEKEAKILFDNDLLIHKTLSVSRYYVNYMAITMGGRYDANNDAMSMFIFRTILGFSFIALDATADIAGKKYRKILDRVLKPKNMLFISEMILDNIHNRNSISVSYNIYGHWLYLHIEQSILDINRSNDLMEAYLHPIIYKLRPNIKRDAELFDLAGDVGSLNWLFQYCLSSGVRTTNKHPNSSIVADIVKTLDSNLIVLFNNPFPKYGDVINLDYVTARKKDILYLNIGSILAAYNINGNTDNEVTLLGICSMLMFILDIKSIAMNYDICIDFTGIDNSAGKTLLMFIATNLKYVTYKEYLKILLTGIDSAKAEMANILNNSIDCFPIVCDINPKTGERYIEDDKNKERDKIIKLNNSSKYKNKGDITNICYFKYSDTISTSDTLYAYDLKEEDEEKEIKPKLVIDKTLNKKYLNIKEDDIDNVISGLKRVVKHKSYKGFVILLNGESGVGKSKLAEIIARELKFDITKISCSDILDKWVGVAEDNVKKYITNNGPKSVLLLDEVDGMLPDRESSSVQHEKSLTSEWLSQLDSPNGIIILTTNYKKSLDKALLRRINLKLTIEDLKPETIRVILNSKIKEFGLKNDLDIKNEVVNLKGLRLGDIGVVDKLIVYNGIETLSKYVDKLKSELKERNTEETKKVGLL